MIQINCTQCKKEINKWPYQIKNAENIFCSKFCRGFYYRTKTLLHCLTCNEQFLKKPCDVKRTKGNFCSQRCAGLLHKNVKSNGSNVSKLEKWLHQKLFSIYPDLEIHYNKKDAINSELDIYIPSMKLAFELNGPYHYEPIWGPEKLLYTQNNDKRKFQACLEKGIELCIIDSSHISYIKDSRCLPILHIITTLIDTKNDSKL